MDKLHDSHKTKRNLCHKIAKDSNLRFWSMMLTPFVVFYIVGVVLQMMTYFAIKVGLFILLYLAVWGVSRVLYDDRVMNVMPMALYLATKFWCYVTWFLYFHPIVGTKSTFLYVFTTLILWYNFLMAARGDPGVINADTSQKYMVR